jgi:hypothetical protein
MKNTVLIKFVNRKIERDLTSNSTFGELMDLIDKIESIAKNSKNLRPGSARYLQEICVNKKRLMRDLWTNKKFFHLSTYNLYKLSQIKERFTPQPEFDIQESPQMLLPYKASELERF